ncbi:hypothetical protein YASMINEVIRUS_244 [Yasminevirus sp. GU-2018]|uniref:Calcineurin-like phosphoesterase domain-containing protein n=1 Tax=Yasminevirus sp. GU-2018 TaxID=2420051 RepID=A0A5K0U8E3_9VIRU|nr:hypothetical protein YASMINEVIRUS_244 [Yasminevirus sp. GU-2018]
MASELRDDVTVLDSLPSLQKSVEIGAPSSKILTSITGEKPSELKNGVFFFVGCWNRLDETINNDCTTIVVNEIANSHQLYGENYDFGVVLGDNIYPDELSYTSAVKMKALKKEFNPEKMARGIKRFDSLDKPLHIVLGNHDIENCDMLTQQTKSYNTWQFRGNLYDTLYEVDKQIVRLIAIDTNVIVDFNPSNESEQLSAGYKELTDKGCDVNFNIDPQKYYGAFKQMLLPQNNIGVSLIIVAGHQPLFTAKEKEGKTKTSVMAFVDDFMESVHELQKSGVDIVYICADLHAFMDSRVELGGTSIRQIVAGTGGASPDPFSSDYIAIIKKTPVPAKGSKTVLRVTEVHNSYGYASFNLRSYLQDHSSGINYRHNKKNEFDSKCFEKKPHLDQEKIAITHASSVQSPVQSLVQSLDQNPVQVPGQKSEQLDSSIPGQHGGGVKRSVNSYLKCKTDYLALMTL